MKGANDQVPLHVERYQLRASSRSSKQGRAGKRPVGESHPQGATDRLALLVRVARLAYEHELSQAEIAELLHVSRSSVSRMLREARERGIVTVTVSDPTQETAKLAQLLKERFDLREAIVVPTELELERQVRPLLAQAAAAFLPTIVRDDDILGVSWGRTMGELVKRLRPVSRQGVSVVQLNGGLNRADIPGNPHHVTQQVAQAFRASAFVLPVPAVVRTRELRRELESDPGIRKVLELAANCTVALYSIGVLSADSVLVQSGYVTPDELARLQARGAVGDIGGRYFDVTGALCDPELESRTIGIELAQLTRKRYAVAVAGGKEKRRAILGALRGGYLNTLVTDQFTGAELLQSTW